LFGSGLEIQEYNRVSFQPVMHPVRLLSCAALFSVAFAQLRQPESLASDSSDRVFTERLKSIGGGHATDCGTTSSAKPEDSVAACGLKAFQDHNPFFLGYYTRSRFAVRGERFQAH